MLRKPGDPPLDRNKKKGKVCESPADYVAPVPSAGNATSAGKAPTGKAKKAAKNAAQKAAKAAAPQAAGASEYDKLLEEANTYKKQLHVSYFVSSSLRQHAKSPLCSQPYLMESGRLATRGASSFRGAINMPPDEGGASRHSEVAGFNLLDVPGIKPLLVGGLMTMGKSSSLGSADDVGGCSGDEVH